jgi:type IV secretion system protein VirB9
MSGALYQVTLGVTNATMILLQPGETLAHYVSGDKERFDVADIQAGSPEGWRPAVMAKCKWSGTRTNLSITTSKRVYLLELHCTENAYHAMVSWDYPGETNTMHIVSPAALPPETTMPVAAAQDPERRNYDYEIKLTKGKEPVSWFPHAVYDNGEKTIIEFPQDITHGDAPVLYLRTAENTQAVVNYRVRGGGTMYEVDRLFDRAELVQGEKKQTVVTIRRAGRKA